MTAHAPAVDQLIRSALLEDVGNGDWTTLWTTPAEAPAEATITAKAPGTLSGTAVGAAVFRTVDAGLEIHLDSQDGTPVQSGDRVLTATGPARSLLTAERTALNFLQHLSGIATLTRTFVDAVKGTGARILDTRKTTPGLRMLEKSAVAAGGGSNHRWGLHDMVLIKENHIAAAGGIRAAVAAVHRHNDRRLLVEVETTTLSEVEEALASGVDRILFDNMPLHLLAECVRRVHAVGEGRPRTEASGGITLATIRSVADCGVDDISVGALTHSAPALDLSLALRLL